VSHSAEGAPRRNPSPHPSPRDRGEGSATARSLAARVRALLPARRGRGLLGVALLGLGGVGWAATRGGPAADTVRVTREDLPLGVEVEGELSAVRSFEIGPPVVRDMWEFKIASLAAESAQVKKGEPLVTFDPSPLVRQLEEKRSEHEEAQKRIERKQVELLAQRRDLELQLAEAMARLDKTRLKAEVPEELRARNEVLLTELDLRGAEQEVANLRARIAALQEAQEASLRSLVSQRDRARGRVAELEAAIEATTLRAPQDGIVIYKTGWRDEKKKVGDSVWIGEKLLALPDLSGMRADGDVDEADGGAVRAGQRVTLRMEALPDRDFAGTVAKIARAVRRKSWRVPNKVFRVQITLDRGDPALRPAMRFRGEIEIGRVPGALTVPRTALFLRPSGPVAWVLTWRGFRETPVRVGRHSRRGVEILEGLSEGDAVAAADLAAEARS
jgi:HlyD family secretion protein